MIHKSSGENKIHENKIHNEYEVHIEYMIYKI